MINGKQYMLSVTHDITDSKRVEEELQKSESQFRSLVHDAPYGIYRVALDGRLLQVNPALVKMLGYESDEELARCNVERIFIAIQKPASAWSATIGRNRIF